MPRISKSIQKHESVMAKDALDDIKMKQMRASAAGQKYSDPNASEGGFQRDGWETTRFENEARQNQLMLEKREKAPLEMPQDLLDFLNDAGPLQRKVNKTNTEFWNEVILLARKEKWSMFLTKMNPE